LHFVLRTLAILIMLFVAAYTFWQARIPEDQRPSPIVWKAINASVLAMAAVAVTLTVMSFR
jgi:ABC-type iron transport system FetAB permease component